MAERKRLGEYVLDRKIGAGGMAEVFLGRRLGEGGFARSVAIKTIAGSGAEKDAIRLFLDEARAAAALEHSSVVRTIDLGYDDDTLYIVMEYVDGPSLARLLKELRTRNRGMGHMQVAHVGARIAEALDFAHRRAAASDGRPLLMVHRDVSPHNIMITRQGAPKLTDFGIARSAIQHHVTKTGMIRGKAAYMAPEQVQAKPLDGRADIFSLGVVLYECLSQRRPFERETDIGSMRAVLKDEAPPIESINKHVPKELAAVIAKAMKKIPDQRYENAEQMAAALREIMRGQSGSDLELGWAKVLDAFFGAGSVDPEDGHPIQQWHPTVAARATPSMPSNPSSLKEILQELSPQQSKSLEPASASLSIAIDVDSAAELPAGTDSQAQVEAPFVAPLPGSAPATRTGSWASTSNLVGLGVLLVLGASLAALIYVWGDRTEPLAVVPAPPPPSAPVPGVSSPPPAVPEPPPPLLPPTVQASKPPPPARVSPPPPPPPAKAKPEPASEPVRVANRELAPIAALLARAQRDEASARELVELGEAIAQAASKVEDEAQRVRIQRTVKNSVNVGDVAGLARAFEDLRRALPREGGR